MKIHLDTVGCRLNQAEIESMACQFRAAGHEIVPEAEQADLAVVNTCTVTRDAAADSRALLRRLAGHTTRGVIATGCWVTLHQVEARSLPGVVGGVPNAAKQSLVAGLLASNHVSAMLETRPRRPLPGQLHRPRAFIKVQDGCDDHCTFCVTTIARGAGRSRPVADVLRDVQAALEGGTQ